MPERYAGTGSPEQWDRARRARRNRLWKSVQADKTPQPERHAVVRSEAALADLPLGEEAANRVLLRWERDRKGESLRCPDCGRLLATAFPGCVLIAQGLRRRARQETGPEIRAYGLAKGVDRAATADAPLPAAHRRAPAALVRQGEAAGRLIWVMGREVLIYCPTKACGDRRSQYAVPEPDIGALPAP